MNSPSTTDVSPAVQGAYQGALPKTGPYAGMNLDQAREYGYVLSDSEPTSNGLSAGAGDVLKLTPTARGNGAADAIARQRALGDSQARMAELQKNIDDLSALGNQPSVNTGGGLRVSSQLGFQLQTTAQGLIPRDNVIDNFARGFSNNSDWSVLEGEKPVSYALGGAARTGLGMVYDGLTGAGDFRAAGQAFDQGSYGAASMYALRGGATAAMTAMTAGDYALARSALVTSARSTGLSLESERVALPSGVGGTGAAYDRVNGQGLYVLRDEEGMVRYVGRGDAPARLGVHEDSIDKGDLIGRVLWTNNLSKGQAKGLEQGLIDHFGGALRQNPNSQLLNQFRSYAPNNPNASIYRDTVTPQLWESTLKKIGG
ncbi:hypothetical protein [Ramlibacter sp.]|uniref:hypothetical protein n=1 Tax=Ramlibacter sp. TaxID=1917967 RepID=UPI0017A5F19B|nr:hypothetical protein [Ramlibacter sp.]MBA2672618.1 hypothetical protein [Ramlibacter sp.]